MPSNWRPSPPTPAEVEACHWWWCKYPPTYEFKEVLVLVRRGDNEVRGVAGDERFDLPPNCQWAPCVPPEDEA